MDPEKIRLPDRKNQLDKAKMDKTTALVCAVVCGAIAVFSAVALFVYPSIAGGLFQDGGVPSLLKHYFMPACLILAVLNVIRYFSDKKTIRELSEQQGEDKARPDPAEEPEEK